MSQFFTECSRDLTRIPSNAYSGVTQFLPDLYREMAGTRAKRLQVNGAICGIVGGIMDLVGFFDYAKKSQANPTPDTLDISLMTVGTVLAVVGSIAVYKGYRLNADEKSQSQGSQAEDEDFEAIDTEYQSQPFNNQ